MEATSSVKRFVFRFVTLPAKWVRTARKDVLNIYSGRPYGLCSPTGRKNTFEDFTLTPNQFGERGSFDSNMTACKSLLLFQGRLPITPTLARLVAHLKKYCGFWEKYTIFVHVKTTYCSHKPKIGGFTNKIHAINSTPQRYNKNVTQSTKR